MKSDCHFEIGSTHLVCQDYALSYADDEIAYAIISDGCTSSPNTDIGSRLISIIARDAISYLIRRQRFEKVIDKKLFLNNFVLTFKELVVKKCIEVKGSLNLDVNSFDATLLVAIVYQGYQPLLVGWGDGNFIIKYKNGSVRTISIFYDGNMPYYLSYRMSYEKDTAYRQEQKGLGHVAEVLPSGTAMQYHHTPWEYNFMRYLDDIKGQDNNPEEVSQIIVSSDGLQSFQYDPKSDEFQTNNKIFTLPEVYSKMIDYKNLVGEFVVRRMKSLEKENKVKHIIHTDDISCATIILE
jgi:Protein phosphatase 2C